LTLGGFGQHFTRHETWGPQAKPWIDYLARSSYMLQQGRFVADVLYFYGEHGNITGIFSGGAPDVPAGFNFDYANSDVVRNQLSVANGHLVTRSGMRYRVLALDPNSRRMTLPVLRKIRDLVEAGAVVIGAKPDGTPSLADDAEEHTRIANALWRNSTGKTEVGKGLVFGSQSIAAVLTELQVQPDFTYTKSDDQELLFVHRSRPDADVYFVSNRRATPAMVDASFRVAGREAEVWRADSGTMTPASYRIDRTRTTVPLRMAPYEAYFVVFRKPATHASRNVADPVEASLATIAGDWTVQFAEGLGAPEEILLPSLSSWSKHPNPGVRYFSGTGTYRKTVTAPRAWFKPGQRLWLDLGEVKNLAEVKVNGKPLGIAWKAPFRVDVTDALKPGVNKLQIDVTNLWVNRLIGDQQPGATKYAFATEKPYSKESPLLSSGLLGPVSLIGTRLP
jgi:hypothetical protein